MSPQESPRAAGTDSGPLSPVWAGTPVEAVTSDEAWLAAMVEFEAELATAQARLGAVPPGTAAPPARPDDIPAPPTPDPLAPSEELETAT